MTAWLTIGSSALWRTFTTLDCATAPSCDIIGNRGAGGDDVGTNGSIRLSDQQRIDWLRLIRSENIGPRTFRALINEFGSASRALARVTALARRGGGREIRVATQAEAEAEIKTAAKAGVRYVAIGEDNYPPRLRETDDAPPLLAVRGQLAQLTRPTVALVGSRNASAAGIRFASVLARDMGLTASSLCPALRVASTQRDIEPRSKQEP